MNLITLVNRHFELQDNDTFVDIIHVQNVLAWMYFKQGMTAEAEAMLLQAHQSKEHSLGKPFPDPARVLQVLSVCIRATLTDAQEVAQLFHKLGKYDSSEQYNARALAIRENNMSVTQSNIAEVLDQLAQLHLSKGEIASILINQHFFQGNFTKAMELSERSLELTQRELGKRHIKTSHCYNDLGNISFKQGKLDKAETLYKNALEIREKILGTKHLDYAESLHSLAYLYTVKGRYTEAEQLYQRAITIVTQVFANQHPFTAQIKRFN
jgi:tetratricopeptide (TPR) repeat protein